MKVSINSVSKKKYKHSYRQQLTTSSEFKFVQPVFCRLLESKEKIKVDFRAFARLAPLIYPVFGQMSVRFSARFVPMEMICPQFPALLSKEITTDMVSTRSYLRPQNVFMVTPDLLFNICYDTSEQQYTADHTPFATSKSFTGMLNRSASNSARIPFSEWYDRFSDIIPEVANNPDFDYSRFNYTRLGDTEEDNVTFNAFEYDYYKAALSVVDGSSSLSDVESSFTDEQEEFMSAYNSADYVVINNNSTGAASSCTCYYLTEYGRQLRKIFLGLGYQIRKNDTTLLNGLPILAYYKSYFDRFYPKRGLDWQFTRCYALIRALEGLEKSNHAFVYPYDSTVNGQPWVGVVDSVAKSVWDSCAVKFQEFIRSELALTYGTHDIDFVAVHRASLNEGNHGLPDQSLSTLWGDNDNPNVSLNPIVNGTENANVSTSSVATGQAKGDNAINTDSKVPVSSGSVSAFTIEFLKRAQSLFSRDSLIGNNIKSYVKNHFNEEVYNILYNNSQYWGESSLEINISDVDSNAQTLSTDSASGDNLGSYAGKGLGNTSLSFTNTADCAGYVIVMMWIETNNSIWQGVDPSLVWSSADDFPQQQYDALGYEITPRTCFYTDNDISMNRLPYSQTHSDSSLKEDVKISLANGFGYVPRYSRFKTSHNVVNGDFSRKSKISDLSSFYLDKYIVARDVDFNNVHLPLPAQNFGAGFVRKLPVASSAWQYNAAYDWMSNLNRVFYNQGNIQDLGNPYRSSAYDAPDDNIFIAAVIDFECYNTLKPLSASYDTRMTGDDDNESVTPA